MSNIFSRIGVYLATVLFFLGATALPAVAAEPGFIDKHGAKGVTCAQCHKETPPAVAVPSAQCQTCHGDNDAMAKKTEKVKPNPHFTHLGDVECTECHHNHKPSEVMCDTCHKFNLKAP